MLERTCRLAGICITTILSVVACTRRASEPIAVEVHLMSQCPFGHQALVAALTAAEQLGDGVQLSVHFIGDVSGDKLSSPRGDSEVHQAKLELCALSQGQNQFGRFVRCLAPSNETASPRWETCATHAGLDVPDLRNCAEGKKGHELLRGSFLESARRGITASPTIRVHGETYAGARHSSKLTRAICTAAADDGRGVRPICNQLPEPPSVGAVVVIDPRCDTESCDPRPLEKHLEETVPGVRLSRVGWDSGDGEKLRKLTRLSALPFVVLGPELAADPEAVALLGTSLRQLPGGRHALPFGRAWDPSREVCSNGADDDGDGAVDCNDSDCENVLQCRPERTHGIDLFFASQDVFSLRALEAISTVLEFSLKQGEGTEGTIPSVRLHPVGRLLADGQLQGLNAVREVADAKRVLCLQTRETGNGARAVAFLRCVAGQDEELWTECLSNKERSGVLECAEGVEGEALARAAFEEAQALRVPKVPYVLVRNRYPVANYAPETIASELCRSGLSSVCGLAEATRQPATAAASRVTPR
jgi:hypothetical protein